MEDSNEYGSTFLKRREEFKTLPEHAQSDSTKRLLATATIYTSKSF
jgi:hypothetical protein